MEEEESRREAAIESLASKFKFTSASAASQARLTKFQELHKRRLQIKSHSKTKNKSKASSFKTKTILQEDGEDSHQETNHEFPFSNKPQKQQLHWGLHTKERWERKSNM